MSIKNIKIRIGITSAYSLKSSAFLHKFPTEYKIIKYFQSFKFALFLKHIYIVYTFLIIAFGDRYVMAELPKKTKVNKKDGQLLIRINSAERDEFVQLCETLDTSAARELRKFIRSFIKKHQPTDTQTKE